MHIISQQNDKNYEYRKLRARENAGLSQRELAERSGVPQSTIARIERGYNTSIDTLSKIAFALNKRVKISFI